MNERTYTPILINLGVYPIQHIEGPQDNISEQKTCQELHASELASGRSRRIAEPHLIPPCIHHRVPADCRQTQICRRHGDNGKRVTERVTKQSKSLNSTFTSFEESVCCCMKYSEQQNWSSDQVFSGPAVRSLSFTKSLMLDP